MQLEIFFTFLCIKNIVDGVAVKWHSACDGNDDCALTHVCREGSCQEVREISEIMSKQKCPRVFKQRCMSDIECLCNEHELVCRDFECNDPKSKPRIIDCKTHHDCHSVELCENFKCREAVSLEELDMLLHFHRCSPTRKCSPGYDCIDGNCMKIQILGG